jgi:hypothetical protein
MPPLLLVYDRAAGVYWLGDWPAWRTALVLQ